MTGNTGTAAAEKPIWRCWVRKCFTTIWTDPADIRLASERASLARKITGAGSAMPSRQAIRRGGRHSLKGINLAYSRDRATQALHLLRQLRSSIPNPRLSHSLPGE